MEETIAEIREIEEITDRVVERMAGNGELTRSQFYHLCGNSGKVPVPDGAGWSSYVGLTLRQKNGVNEVLASCNDPRRLHVRRCDDGWIWLAEGHEAVVTEAERQSRKELNACIQSQETFTQLAEALHDSSDKRIARRMAVRSDIRLSETLGDFMRMRSLPKEIKDRLIAEYEGE